MSDNTTQSASSNESHESNSTTWPSVPHSNRFDTLRTIADDYPSSNAKHKVSPKRQLRLHHSTAEEDKVPTKVTVVGSSVVRGVAPLVNGKEFDTVG